MTMTLDDDFNELSARLTTAERERDRFREALESEDVWCDCNEYRASTRAARGEQRYYMHHPGAPLCGMVEVLSVNGEQDYSRLPRQALRDVEATQPEEPTP